MIAARSIRLSACLIACLLAIAGCTGAGTGTVAGDLALQNLAGGEASPSQRPTLVLVNNFEFSDDVEVVDREFGARLSSKLGDTIRNDAIKGITVKRVADEIEATVVAILHEETNLTVKAGDDENIPPNSTTLVVTGKLRAAEQGNRAAPTRFGAGTAADVGLLLVSGGARKQLLNFTAQAQSGHAGGGVDQRMLGAQIAAVLGSKSAPDVKLSPEVEAQARGLGRAIAQKIVAYTMQQGWARRVSAPPPMATEKPAEQRSAERPPADRGSAERRRGERKPKEIPASAAARPDAAAAAPAKPFPCQAFTRNARGNLYVTGPVTVDIGTEKDKTLQNLEIPPKFFTIGGVDLYAEVQKQCGRRAR